MKRILYATAAIKAPDWLTNIDWAFHIFWATYFSIVLGLGYVVFEKL